MVWSLVSVTPVWCIVQILLMGEVRVIRRVPIEPEDERWKWMHKPPLHYTACIRDNLKMTAWSCRESKQSVWNQGQTIQSVRRRGPKIDTRFYYNIWYKTYIRRNTTPTLRVSKHIKVNQKMEITVQSVQSPPPWVLVELLFSVSCAGFWVHNIVKSKSQNSTFFAVVSINTQYLENVFDYANFLISNI